MNFFLVIYLISCVQILQADNHIETNDDHRPSTLSFVTPTDGEEIRFTPFRVEVAINGTFRVPQDGEIQISMTYRGRGTQIRVLQDLYFMCWNVGDSELEIKAQLVTTRDIPIGIPVNIQVRQRPGPHFVLLSPSDGQIFVAHR